MSIQEYVLIGLAFVTIVGVIGQTIHMAKINDKANKNFQW